MDKWIKYFTDHTFKILYFKMVKLSHVTYRLQVRIMEKQTIMLVLG